MNPKKTSSLKLSYILSLSLLLFKVNAMGVEKGNDLSAYGCMQPSERAIFSQVALNDESTSISLLKYALVFKKEAYSIVLSPENIKAGFQRDHSEQFVHLSGTLMSLVYGEYQVLAQRDERSDELLQLNFRGPPEKHKGDIEPYTGNEFELVSINKFDSKSESSQAIFVLKPFDVEMAKELFAIKMISQTPFPGFYVEALDDAVKGSNRNEEEIRNLRKRLSDVLKACPNLNAKTFIDWVRKLKSLGVELRGTTYNKI